MVRIVPYTKVLPKFVTLIMRKGAKQNTEHFEDKDNVDAFSLTIPEVWTQLVCEPFSSSWCVRFIFLPFQLSY